MAPYRLAVLTVASALFLPPPAWAASIAQVPAAGVDGATLVLAYLKVAYLKVGRDLRPMSVPLRPVAESCKDKCENDRDKCFNACTDDAIQGAVCRDGCTDTYDKCLKGC